jgi:hypothetical protein
VWLDGSWAFLEHFWKPLKAGIELGAIFFAGMKYKEIT